MMTSIIVLQSAIYG